MLLPEKETKKKTHMCKSFTGTSSGKKTQYIELELDWGHSWLTKREAQSVIASLQFHIARIDKYDKEKKA